MFYQDHRVTAQLRTSPWDSYNEASNLLTVPVHDGDTSTEYEVPAEFSVCPTCQGKGSYVNPAIDADGITDWHDWSDEDREAYTVGRYDVPCHTCQGKRVIPTPSGRANPEALQAIREQQRREAEDAAELARELRYGY